MAAPDIEEQAARWIVRLEADPSPATQAKLSHWLAADPRHRAAYVRLNAGWRRANRLRFMRPLDGAVDEDLLRERDFVESLEAPPTPSVRKRRRPWVLIAATAMVVICAGITSWVLVHRSDWNTYTTDLGGFQRVSLSDGSLVQLNTKSEMRVRLTGERREVVLVRGEAMFTVAHDANRPFDVTAGKTLVRAVGTAFSVRLRDKKEVEVFVTEGRVVIDPPDNTLNLKLTPLDPLPSLSLLNAGETAMVKAGRMRVEAVRGENVTRKLSWTEGRLWFDRTTLAEAVAEFNRYNRRQLTITDPKIAGLRIGGGFESTDPESFVAALEHSFHIKAVVLHTDESGAELIELRPVESAAP